MSKKASGIFWGTMGTRHFRLIPGTPGIVTGGSSQKLGKNMIIQGVAGSGKTTVALHRIAYLVYNNREIYKPSDYMVIGPNKFFVNYISGILPDLDVNGVSEYTLEEVLEKYTSDKYIINNSLDKILNHDSESRFKTSLKILAFF